MPDLLLNKLACALALLTPAAASAESHSQLQADLGLSVVGAGYETPLGNRLAVMVEGQIFSTYFAPWFDVGDELTGFGAGLRATYFSEGERGLYVTPYLRINRVTADDVDGSDVGYSAGFFVGWRFSPIGAALDVRLGAGAQYMSYKVGAAEVETPFVALDILVGYRL